MGIFSSIIKGITGLLGDIVGFLIGVDFDEFDDQAQGALVNKQSNIDPIPVVYGTRKVGGVRVFVSTGGGKKNEYLYMAIALCEGEIQAIDQIYVNDKVHTHSDYSGLITVTKKLGADGQQYASLLAGADDSWGTNHRLRGVAYLAIRIKYDADVFGGIPEVQCVIRGRKVYDPRTSTTAYSDNPALCLRDYLTNSRYGKGLPTSAIDDTKFIAAANEYDGTVTSYTGGPSITFISCNARLDTGKTVFDNVKEMLQGMRGLLPYTDGKYGLIVDKAETSTFDLTPDNILSDITVTDAGKGKRFNRVIAKFPNPQANWQMDSVTYPVKSTDPNSDFLTFLDEDNGEELVREINLNTITSLYQARDMARVVCEASRRNTRSVTLTATSEAMEIAVGDVVRLEQPSLGWTGSARQLMRVVSTRIKDSGEVDLQLIEYNNVYAWFEGDEELDNQDTTLPNPFDVTAPTAPNTSEDSALGPDGSVQTAVTLSWTEADDAFVSEYEVQWGLSSAATYSNFVRTSETTVDLFGLQVGSEYTFRVRSINTLGVRSDFITETRTLVGDTVAPGSVTLDGITPGIRAITATWTNPTDLDYAFTEVHVKDVNTTPSVNDSPTRKIAGEEYVHPVGPGEITRYFFLRAVDFSGNKGSFTGTANNSGTSVKATQSDLDDDSVGSDQIESGAVTTAAFAAGLKPVQVVSALPNSALHGDMAFLTTDNKLYRYDSSAWTKAVDGADIIANSITSGKILAGAIGTTELAADAVVASKINVTSLDDISSDAGDIDGGSIGGITISPTKLYQGNGTWASSNTGFYLDNTGKFSLKDKLFFNPSNTKLTVAGNIEADTITVNDSLVVLGPLEAKSLAPGSITREMFSQDALDEIFGSLATSVGGSNGDFKENTGNFTASGGTVTLGTTSDKFEHGTASVDVEFLVDHFFYVTTNYTTTQAQATLNFEVSANGTFTDLASATKTHTLQFNEYDLSSYYGYTYLVYYLTGDVTKTFTTSEIADNTDLQFRVRVTSVGTAFTGQTVPFTLEANEGVTGVVSTGGNADTLDNLDSTAFLRSNTNDTFDGDLTITGQLILNGSIDQYNVTDLDVSDKTITVNSGNTQTLSDGAGLIVDRGAAADASILWNETDDQFDVSHNIATPSIYLTKNVATTTGNGTFSVSKTRLGNIHITNGAGANGSPKEAAITFQGSNSSQSQAGIYVVNDNSSGTHMALATTNSYAIGPKIAININNFGKVNFPRSRPTYDGYGLWASSDFTSADISNWDAAYGWGDHSTQGYLTSYTETDTLATVTGRGATTTNAISTGAITSGGNIQASSSAGGGFSVGTDSIIGSNKRLTAADGTASKAAYGFQSSSSTGLSYTSGNRLNFLSNGVVKAYIQPGSSNPISPVLNVDGRTEINGVVTWTGGSSTNANTAYGWGDHASVGYSDEYKNYPTASGGDHDTHHWNKTHAAYSNNGGSPTYIVLTTNVPQDNYSMGGFTLIFQNNYSGNDEGDVVNIYGYWNPESNSGFIGFRYHTSNPDCAPTIQVGRNSSGKTVFLISNESGNYAQVVAKDLYLGYSAGSATSSWGDSWAFSEASSTTGISNLNTLNRVGITAAQRTNWNTAYTYSQVGHLPLAGGALTGAVTSTGNITTTGNVSGEQFRASYGTATEPAYTFKNDDDTGMYGANGSIKFAVNGSSRYTIGATAHTMTGNLSLLGALSVGSVPQTVISSSRVLSNVTANANIITAGTLNMSRLTAAITPRNATELSNSTDLDDLNGSSAGFYYQTANADTPNNHYPSNEAGSLIVQKSAGNATQLYQTYGKDTPKLYFRSNYTTGYGSWRRVFADDYHPNADKWTTARTVTVTLTGDVTGTANASIDGSVNKTITIATSGSFTETDTLATVTGRGATTSNAISTGAITATTLKETDGGDGFTEIGSSNFGYFSWGVEIANPNANYRAMRFAGKKKYFVLEADVLGTSNANHTGMFWGNADGTSIYAGNTTGYKTTHQNTSLFHIRDINGNANQETYNPGFSPSDGAWHHQKIAATPDGYVRVWIDGDLKFEETGYIPSAAGYLGFINYQGTLRLANIRCRTINEDESQHYSQHIGNPNGAYADDDRFIKLANNTANNTGTLVTADNGNTWLNADGGKDLWLNWVSLNNKSSKADLQVGDGNYGAAIFSVDAANRRVGVNDSSPSYSLDVNGTARITGAITSNGSVTAGNASTSLGYYVGTTQVIQGSTRNLVNIGTITSAAITTTADISIPVAKKLYFGGGTHTYISEDIDDRMRFFVGGAEFMRFTEGSSDSIGLYTATSILNGTLSVLGGNIDLRNNTAGDGSIIRDINFMTTAAEGSDDRVALIRGRNQGGSGTTRGGNIVLYTRKANQSGFNATVMDNLGNFTLEANAYLAFGDTNTKVEEGGGNSVRVVTNHGYMEIGPQNGDWAHIQTDRTSFYFNRKITVDTGIVESYNEDLILRRAQSSADQITLGTSGVTFASGYNLNTTGGAITSGAIQGSSTIDSTNVTTGTFRVYDGSTFRGGLGTGQWASGLSSQVANWSLYAVNTLNFHSNNSDVPQVTQTSSGFNSTIPYQINGTTVIDVSRNISSGAITTSGNISLTGGGMVEAPSSSGGENLVLRAAGEVTVDIDSNGNSGDNEYFRVRKHTNTDLFTVKETGEAKVYGPIEAKSLITQGTDSGFGLLRITHPDAAENYQRTSSKTGAIKITLPVSWTSTMMRMTIQVYEYSQDESFTVYCGGYNYGSSSVWINTFAQIISSGNKNRDFTVRFAHDGTKCCIFIGELNSTWSYPQVAVTDFQAGFNAATTANWGSGWDVGYETSSFGTVSSTESNTDIGVHHSSISVGGSEVITTARNLTNIGTISSGSITSSGNVVSTGTHNGSQFRASLGTQSAPAYTFKTDDDTGFYGGGNTVYGVTGGQKRLTLNASGVSAHNDLIVLTGNLKFGTSTVIDSNRRNIYLDSFAGGDNNGIFFRNGFTSNSLGYNCSITVKDHNGASADGLHISGYDGVGIGTGANTYSLDLLVDVSGNTNIYGHTNSVNGYKVNGTTVIDSNKNLGNIGGGLYKANLGSTSFSWGGSTNYATLYGSHPDRWVMMTFPHIPYLQNSVRGFTGSSVGAVVRMESSTDYTNYWDVGVLHSVSGKDFAIASNANSPKMRINTNGTAHFYRGAAWGETTQGPTKGTIHLDPESATDHFGGAITFGASDSGGGDSAHAGIYTRSDGSYGTKMYLATTDSYATGSKTAMTIDHGGAVTINRSTLNAQNGFLVAGTTVITASRNLANITGLDMSASSSAYVNLNRSAFITFYGNGSANHGIGSRQNTGGATDDLRINSYAEVCINLDSNNNNTSNADFLIGRHGGGIGAVDLLLSVSGEDGDLVTEGNVTAYGSPSDIRLKDNVKRIDDPIGKVKQLDGITFNYKKDGSESTGLIAQQLLEVLPQVVYETKDLNDDSTHYAVRYGQVVGLLVEAIKDQQDQIDTLKNIIEEMKNGDN